MSEHDPNDPKPEVYVPQAWSQVKARPHAAPGPPLVVAAVLVVSRQSTNRTQRYRGIKFKSKIVFVGSFARVRDKRHGGFSWGKCARVPDGK